MTRELTTQGWHVVVVMFISLPNTSLQLLTNLLMLTVCKLREVGRLIMASRIECYFLRKFSHLRRWCEMLSITGKYRRLVK